MTRSDSELESNLYNIMELYEHFHNLYKKTKILSDEIIKANAVALIELRLSEIYSLFNTAKLFISINGDISHYQFSSLLNFWEQAYLQMYLVVRDNDNNTSWMRSEIDNFLDQYKLVEKMLTSQIEKLKSTLGNKTAD